MRIVFVLQTLSTLVCGSILGFYAVWQLMLIVLVMIIVYALTIAAIIHLTENHMNDKTRTLQKASMVFFFFS
jgi:ABC-type bacteriocin/lantibiotic exporter with double-glycine peptidase domain